MIKDVNELKDLILWAKDQRIKTLEVATVKITFSDLAFVDAIADLGAKDPETESLFSAPTGNQDDYDDEKLLFHSAT